MFGNQFRILRKKQNISLSEAAGNIISVSNLSRWENGLTEINFDQVIELLDNIHISPLEFISTTVITPHTPLIDEINKALQNKSINELKKIATQWLKIYKYSDEEKDLFNAAMACNYLLDFSNGAQKIFPNEYLLKLEQIFSDVNYWSHYYVSAFGNCISLLEPKRVYGFSFLIIDNINEIKKGGYEYFLDTMTTLLNAATTLIVTSPSLAQKLIFKLNSISLGYYSMFIKVRLKFLNALLIFQKNNDSSDVTKIINSLGALGMTEVADKFKQTYKYISTHSN